MKESLPKRSEKLAVQLHRENSHVLLLALTCGSLDGLKFVAAVLLSRSFDLCMTPRLVCAANRVQHEGKRTWDLTGSKRGFFVLVSASSVIALTLSFAVAVLATRTHHAVPAIAGQAPKKAAQSRTPMSAHVQLEEPSAPSRRILEHCRPSSA